MRRCRLKDQFQILEKLLSEQLLFIDKGYNEKVIPGYTFTFCLTKPVDKEVKIIVVVIQTHKRGCVG